MRVLYLGLAVLLVSPACTKGDKTAETAVEATSSADDRAERAAVTANAIAANPAVADSILTAAGHTQASFQQLMYEIAADSEKSAAYASAKAR